MDRTLEIDGGFISLEEVANNDNRVLYRFIADDRICGAPLREIKEKFPEYKFGPFERGIYDFLIEKDGSLQMYDPDGEPICEDEI